MHNYALLVISFRSLIFWLLTLLLAKFVRSLSTHAIDKGFAYSFAINFQLTFRIKFLRFNILKGQNEEVAVIRCTEHQHVV